jgi:tetratricopeptide (TPR) repeat protein
MLGPKTENSVTDSQNVNQVGHNSGTIHIGLTFEQHERNVRERLAEKQADLERAHIAETAELRAQLSAALERADRAERAEPAAKKVPSSLLALQDARIQLQAQVDAAVASLSNLQSDYEKTLAELADLKATLARYDNVLDRTKHAAADAALDRGDLSLAKALLKELSAFARARREDASKEEAELEFKLGEIAEMEIRWHDAAAHFTTVAKLHPAFHTLYKAREFAWRAGDYLAAIQFGESLLNWAKAHGTIEEFATALNEHALTMLAIGQDENAKALLTQASKISKLINGNVHYNHATNLNNLANALLSKGQYFEAESLYHQVLEIDAATVGTSHPSYACSLNNLASVIEAQGRYTDAETLLRQALGIDEVTIGSAHPEFGIKVNNLGNILRRQRRHGVAVEQYRRSLVVFREALGAGHPHTRLAAANLLTLLQTHFPDDPEIPSVQALLSPNPCPPFPNPITSPIPLPNSQGDSG